MQTVFVENLSIWYTGKDKKIIHGLSFSANKGDLVLVKGANGSGKSTLLRALANFTTNKLQMQFDQYKLEGRPSLIIQEPELQILSFNVVEEIAMRLSFRRVKRGQRVKQVEDLLEMFNLEELRNRDPHHLSAGEQQMVIILASIIDHPKIILLDEPFTYLDHINVTKFKQYLLELQKIGFTIIVSTHLDVLDPFATKEIVLGDQQLTSEGSSVIDLSTAITPSNQFYLNGWIGYNQRLRKLDLEFNEFGVYVITGRNGSGKTCLLQTLAGITPLVDGNMDIDENAVLIPQRVSLLFTKALVRDELRGLAIPWWLEAYQNYSPFKLSVGYQKVLAIYICLSNFKTCVIDEPFQSLDPFFKTVVLNLLKEHSTTNLIVISTNRELQELNLKVNPSHVIEVDN